MTAQLLDGNALAKKIREEVSGRTAALKAKGVQPHLAIVLVGEDPASQVYVKHKVADSEQTGLKATLERYVAGAPKTRRGTRESAAGKRISSGAPQARSGWRPRHSGTMAKPLSASSSARSASRANRRAA